MGWFCMKQHGSAFSRLGTPDLLCLRPGRRAVWLEVKQPGKRPTPIQMSMMRTLEMKAGTPCYVVTSRHEAEACLKHEERAA
jgi:hypothetical protein